MRGKKEKETAPLALFKGKENPHTGSCMYVNTIYIIPYKNGKYKMYKATSGGCTGGHVLDWLAGWEQWLPGVSAGCPATSRCRLYGVISASITLHTFINLSWLLFLVHSAKLCMKSNRNVIISVCYSFLVSLSQSLLMKKKNISEDVCDSADVRHETGQI